MSTSIPILNTKLYSPPPPSDVIMRSRLSEQLNRSVQTRLTLVSAPAGFGKTTAITTWLSTRSDPVAWLSLDASDADLSRFMTYLAASLQTLDNQIGTGLLTTLQSPQLPPLEMLLTPLLNDIAQIPNDFFLVLDDYHVLEAPHIDAAVSFLLDYLPHQMHLIITTREDPQLPLARLRVRAQLIEIRAADLRFTQDEAVAFIDQAVGVPLSSDEMEVLEKRTEGWIAGLQLASLSMQNLDDKRAFIETFSGSHHFVLDYLVEEVLQYQPDVVQNFLMETSILERFCAELCDVVMERNDSDAILRHLARANMFLVPLDQERKWFRYHHLFGDLLRQRLAKQQIDTSRLQQRASLWFEQHGFELEAFQLAVASEDVQRAAKLVQGETVPLYFRGVAQTILAWLESLPVPMLDANPSLWVMYGWVMSITYQNAQAEPKLQAAEKLLTQDTVHDNQRGQIAALRAMLAANQYQTETIIKQAQLALQFLKTSDHYLRAVVLRTLAVAYQYQGKREVAHKTYSEAIALSEPVGNRFVTILSLTGMGIIELTDTQLRQAEKTFLRVIDLVGKPAQPIACEAYLRLARIYYEWNDLQKAQQHADDGIELARQIDTIDSATSGEIFVARLKLAQGNVAGAAAMLIELERVVQRQHFDQQIAPLVEAQIALYLRQGDLESATQLATKHNLPLCVARVCLAQGKLSEALSILIPYQHKMEAKHWVDERLKAMMVQVLVYHANDQLAEALSVLQEILRLTAHDGFVRFYLDEGQVMHQLLSKLRQTNFMPDYIDQLLVAFAMPTRLPRSSANQTLIEPLSEREIEILQLVAEGLSNREISDRLYLALSTVKGHNRNIYGKLGVKRRTEAVALARKMGLLAT